LKGDLSMKRKDAVKAAILLWRKYCLDYSKGVALGMVILLLIYIAIALIIPSKFLE
jgi:hypothetical protein